MSSQQDTVSILHRDLTHTLLTSYLKSVDIESGRHQLRSPTSMHSLSSLEPTRIYARPASRTLESSTRLSDVAGTSVVVSQVDISRGSERNPTSAINLSTLNVGHTGVSFVDSTVVSIGILSGPGVTLPGFVTQAHFESEMKQVKCQITLM